MARPTTASVLRSKARRALPLARSMAIDHGHAEGHSQHHESGVEGPAQEVAQAGAKEAAGQHRGVSRAAAERTPRARGGLPRSSRTRSAHAATCALWVTSTSVRPACRVIRSRSASTASPVASSRLPVGSSARSSRGSWTSARAMATRCCSPPERRSGKSWARSSEAHLIEEGAPAARGVAGGAARQLGRELDVLDHGQGGDEVEELEDEAHVIAAEERAVAGRKAVQAHPGDEEVAGRGEVDPGHEVEERALAAAAPPADGDELALGDGRGRLAEHDARPGPLGVVLADAVEPDERRSFHVWGCRGAGRGRCATTLTA